MSTVKIFDDNHGVFEMDGDKFVRRIETITSSVNYDAAGKLALQAALSEATEHNYFDTDLAMIAAATLECSFDDFTVNYLMADSDDALWVTEVFNRFGRGRVPTPGVIKGA